MAANRSNKVPGFRSKSKKSITSLKSGRPPLLLNGGSRSAARNTGTGTGITGKLSSKATQNLISKHHNLIKLRAKAQNDRDEKLVAQIDAEITALGGLEAYQAASLTGQSKDRGGDSSVLLVQWLRELNILRDRAARQIVLKPNSASSADNERLSQIRRSPESNSGGLRVLEIGALSSCNAISTYISRGISHIHRLDLNSQEPDKIQQIDFMELPVPGTFKDAMTSAEDEKYDIISLSLVLNYVADAKARGEMLKRTREFLRCGKVSDMAAPGSHTRTEGLIEGQNIVTHPAHSAEPTSPLPCLFIVLPLPCVTNSRYLTSDRLRELLAILGYESIKMHQSAKLHYELFRYHEKRKPAKLDNNIASPVACERMGKEEINPGKGRNNFCIVLDE